jgi:hypothetical protein
MLTDKDVVLATALVQELRLEKVVLTPQCDRAHLCAGDHGRESQDLPDPCRDLERRPSRSAGGDFCGNLRDRLPAGWRGCDKRPLRQAPSMY